MVHFTYTPCFDDYISFEKFKFKRNRSLLFTYIICVFFIAMGIYDVIVSKDYQMLIFAAAMALIDVLTAVYEMKILPKKRVKRILAADSNYLTANEITIDDKAIEIKNIPNENQAGIVAVYPYSVMSVIYETTDYFYFFIGTEVKILAKKNIPQESAQYVKKIISSKRNYIYSK
ncbi:MAG TPA: hypothetical protein DD404_06130 [Ruminococcaceae bacterium]|nr:hypothetical protein [Oscillospiraceae bacterium]